MSDKSEPILYIPGVTPLGEEQAHELQERARSALQSFEDDPSRAADSWLDANVSWQCLPDRDFQLWLDDAESWCSEIVTADSVSAVDQVMRARFEGLVSWMRTAEAWEQLGTDRELADRKLADRKFIEYPGVGGRLGSVPPAVASADSWHVRAASETVERAWQDASHLAGAAVQTVLDRLASDPVNPRLMLPAQHRFKGLLGIAKVGGRDLHRWGTSIDATYTVNRRSSSQRVFWNGQLRVMYAPDSTKRIVWVTDVRLVELLSQVRSVRRPTRTNQRKRH